MKSSTKNETPGELSGIFNLIEGSHYHYLVGILFLSGLFIRLFKIHSIPGVYPDEANYIEMSWHFINLNFQWGCFSHTFLPRLPIPMFSMGLSQLLFGNNLFAIRSITAIIGTTVIPIMAYLHPSRTVWGHTYYLTFSHAHLPVFVS